jgi:hypothetical protein
MAEFNVGPWPTGRDIVSAVHAQQKAAAEKRDECCCLQLIVRILDEAGHLSRGFATAAANIHGPGVAKIGVVEFADTIVREPRALAYGSRPRLVTNHPQGQFKLAALGGVAVIS